MVRLLQCGAGLKDFHPLFCVGDLMSTEVHVVGQGFDFTHLRRKLNPKETPHIVQDLSSNKRMQRSKTHQYKSIVYRRLKYKSSKFIIGKFFQNQCLSSYPILAKTGIC